MEYIPYEKNVNYLPKEKFDKFYKEATEVILDAFTNKDKDKEVSLEDLMKKHNIVLKNTSGVMKKLTPALTANLYAPTEMAMSSCPACAICALCAVCGELNAGVGIMGITGIVSLADSF